MRVLIVGANGYIGSYLSQYFLKKGYHVTTITRSRLNIDTPSYLNLTNLEMDIFSLEFSLLEVEADICIHLASANDVLSKNNPSKAMELSLLGTKAVLDLCDRNKIKNFIFFSTIQVYGRELMGFLDENSPVSIESEYALNHHLAEEYAKFYAQTRDINVVILRPTNVYGCPVSEKVDRWTLVPMCFCISALEKKVISLNTSGAQIRNFISLFELSEWSYLISNSFPNGFEIINLSSINYMSILEIANLVADVYYELFLEKVDVITNQKDALKVNNFTLSRDKIKTYGELVVPNHFMKEEIIKIFHLLTNNK